MTRIQSTYAALFLAATMLSHLGAAPARAIDLQFTIASPGSYTANQLTLLNQGIQRAEKMWESRLIGYQPGINISVVPISVQADFSGLAAASPSGTVQQGGYTLTTSGFLRFNVNEIENFASWQGPKPNGLNFIDEVIAHEVGHVLGIGTLWGANFVYANDYHYTGAFGLAAYKAEFDPAATFVPVENAGNAGTPHSHWDQLMRSSPQEGNPSDPFSLDPRVGVTDSLGRDRGLELMTGAIDPDYFEPFVSHFTIQSMRDLGYRVAEFEDFNSDGVVDGADLDVLNANMGATGLQVDSFRFGDANGDRSVNRRDLTLWQHAVGIPEPGTLVLAGVALLAVLQKWRPRLFDAST